MSILLTYAIILLQRCSDFTTVNSYLQLITDRTYDPVNNYTIIDANEYASEIGLDETQRIENFG